MCTNGIPGILSLIRWKFIRNLMAILVIGGHSRNVGKTSVVAGLIAALPERRWTAVKITQFGHGICSVNGESCDCATDEHTVAISEERDAGGGTDTSRFLLAGAQRSLWVRSKQGFLAEVMPSLRKRLEGESNVIVESNSVIRFLRRSDVSLKLLHGKTIFRITPPQYVTPEIVDWVRQKIGDVRI